MVDIMADLRNSNKRSVKRVVSEYFNNGSSRW